MADEAFHEIQLNGKQLVFLFMASTVVAVVIFLCGIMVGRGVRAQRGELAAVESSGDPTATVAPASPAASVGGAGGTSPAARDSLTYPERLGADTPIPEILKEPEPGLAGELSAVDPTSRDVRPALARGSAAPKGERATTASVPASVPALAPAPPAASPLTASATAAPTAAHAPAPAASAAAVSAPGEMAAPPGDGFTVQVGTSNERAAAEKMAKRLTAKGYPAYVTAPAAGARRIFRVRVGKFKDRSEAESVANRLEKEEQFKPWITR